MANRPEWFKEELKLTLEIGSGWRYLTSVQSNILDRAIKLLDNAKTQDRQLCINDFVKGIGFSWDTTSRVLGLLVQARIFRVEQRGRVVLYRFVSGWRERLKVIAKKRGVKNVS
jgi:hypothetical protein